MVYKNAHVAAATAAGDHPEMDAAANRVKAAILATAARHRKSGDLNRSLIITTVGRGKDRLISSTDPNILSIEYGHWRNNADGQREWVEGIRVFNRAYTALKNGG